MGSQIIRVNQAGPRLSCRFETRGSESGPNIVLKLKLKARYKYSNFIRSYKTVNGMANIIGNDMNNVVNSKLNNSKKHN